MFEAAVFRADVEESERGRGKGEEAGRGRAGGRDDVGTAVFTVAGNKDGRGSGGNGVRLEAWMSALQVKGTTGLSTSESMKDAGTTHPRQTTLTTIGNPPKPLVSILKPHPTTSRNPSTFSNLKPNSSAQQTNNKPLRTPTLHPIATVQDNPNSYPHPNYAEPEYRDKELYDRSSVFYEPEQWADQSAVSDSSSGSLDSYGKGRKRQREEDGSEDGDDGGEGQGEGVVPAEKEVSRRRGGRRLRANKG